ncbi:hypothetical protein O3G_MSEX015316 [Manduca sexta]|uniref:Uncharacterized protein n=1 Tax=Manduca sexta TaxID=7130 RepID=A0A921ZWT4_MANSE|nr:hypothetical protein O3G_MSEX015316 [Manduca sexta]
MRDYFTRPLKTQDIPLDIREFENMMIRKHGTMPIFLLFKKSASSELPIEKFDENGMIFLTPPKRNKDRGLIRMINEILKDKEVRNNFIRKYGDEGVKIPTTKFEFTDLVS